MTSRDEPLVVDATVAVKWVVAERDSDRAAALQGRRLLAPELLVAECANVLWKKTARGELTADEAAAAAMVLEAAEVELVPSRPYLAASVRIATALGHPAYDALYLAVAGALGLPLVTADDRLVQAVGRSGVPTLRDRVIPLARLPRAAEGA